MSKILKKYGKGLLAVALLVVAVSIAVLIYFNIEHEREQNALNAPKEPPVLVEVIAVTSTAQETSHNHVGVVQPQETLLIMPPVISTVEEVFVVEGDTVTPGQTVVQLDTELADTQVANATDGLTASQSVLAAANAEKAAAQAAYDASQKRPTQEQIDLAKADMELSQAEASAAAQTTAAAQLTLDTAQADVAAKQTALDAATAETVRIQAELDALPDTDPNYAAKQAQLTAAQQAQNEAQTQLQTAQQNADIEGKQAALLAAQRAELTAQTDAAASRATYETLSAANTTVDAETALAQLRAADIAVSQAQTSAATAQQTYDEAIAYRAEHTVTAPFGGEVVSVMAVEGTYALPTTPLVVVASDINVVTFGLTSEQLQTVEVGEAVEIEIGDDTTMSYIETISPVPDEQSRTYTATAPITDIQSSIGQAARITLHSGKQNGIWLPINVLLSDGEDYVFMVEDGRAIKRSVTIMDIANDLVRVEGLVAGEFVISENMKLVRSGDEVEVG